DHAIGVKGYLGSRGLHRNCLLPLLRRQLLHTSLRRRRTVNLLLQKAGYVNFRHGDEGKNQRTDGRDDPWHPPTCIALEISECFRRSEKDVREPLRFGKTLARLFQSKPSRRGKRWWRRWRWSCGKAHKPSYVSGLTKLRQSFLALDNQSHF